MRRLLKVSAAVAIMVCFAFALPNRTEKFEVVIDAGHGGKDYGSAYGDFTEKQINEIISKKVKNHIENKDVEVHFTRLNDEFIDLSDRVEMINRIKPDLVLSLHTNFTSKENNNASGIEIFVGKNSIAKDKSIAHAKALANSMKGYKFYSKETKEASFYVLNKVESPAILLEMGFLSNEGDRTYLTDEAGQDKLAQTIASFINDIK